MVAAHKARQIEGLAGGCARSMMAEKSYCAAVLFLYLPFTMPYITHGFLRADSRNSMGFILLYGKKNVSRYGFRHSVLEATRRPVCHVILQRCCRHGCAGLRPLRLHKAGQHGDHQHR